MIDKQKIKDDKTAEEANVDVSKRTFIKAAALGVVAAGAAFSTILISKASDTALSKRVKTAYMNDDLQQDKVMSQKQLVLMTDEEKKQMLNEILHDYHVTA